MPVGAVVDASVLVSAFLFPDSTPGRVVKLAAAGRFTMHLSPILLNETRDALLSRRMRKSYTYAEQVVLAWIDTLRQTGNVFTGPLPDIGLACRDPDDDHVIAAAVAVGAGVIVTGEKDLLAMVQYEAIRIVPARSFLSELDDDVTTDVPSDGDGL